jgi:hypothetical protein
MIKIGKYYYKNFWALIAVIIFRKPKIYMPKGFKPESLKYNPMENDTIEDFLYGSIHEDFGDK